MKKSPALLVAIVLLLVGVSFLIAYAIRSGERGATPGAGAQPESTRVDRPAEASEQPEAPPQDPVASSPAQQVGKLLLRVSELEEELRKKDEVIAGLRQKLEAGEEEAPPVPTFESLAEALAGLKTAFKEGNGRARRAAEQALREFLREQPELAREVLEYLRLLSDPGLVEEVTELLVRALCHKDAPETLREELLTRLVDLVLAQAQPELRAALLDGLRTRDPILSDSDVRRLLELLRYERDGEVRKEAIKLLRTYAQDQELAAALLELARDELDEDLKRDLYRGLQRATGPVVENFVLQALETEQDTRILRELINPEALLVKINQRNKERFAISMGAVLQRDTTRQIKGQAVFNLAVLSVLFNSEKALPVLHRYAGEENDPLLCEVTSEVIRTAESGQAGLGEMFQLYRRYRDKFE